ncbi:origin recognition complex subunit 4 [Lobosporangium transversale]|nr:origin recognition complex subunit 4 [Lobosporangium transversale]
MSLNNWVEMAKCAILARLSERTLPPSLVGLEEQYNSIPILTVKKLLCPVRKIADLMRQTIEMGESNSCLILGPRGTGKTMLVRKALNEMENLFGAARITEETDQDMAVDNEARKDFMVIRLNGLVQTDDRMALKEIMRQLSREGESGMANSNVSFADSLPSLLSFLKSGTRDQYPIIFVMEEFDLFAQHTKQSLLYNLFDIAQSAEWPIAVIGVSCRMDALELLEKRVKSRFSHRQYYTFPPESYYDFIEICQNMLLLSLEDMNIELEDGVYVGEDVNEKEAFINEFNDHVKFGPVASLSETNPYLRPPQFYESGLQQRVDNKTELLKGISLLELSLLIAIKHLVEREIVSFNFEMVYDEYKEFMDMAVLKGASGSSSLTLGSGGSIGSTDSVSLRLYKKAVALKAFEHLVETELLRPADASGKGPKEYRMMQVMLDSSQIADIVLKHRDCPTLIARWAARRQS